MAREKSYDLSIVILNFNVRDLLLKCLESVFKSLQVTGYRVQIIVVDNASKDGSVGAVRAFREKYKTASHIGSGSVVEVIASKINLGFAGGNNLAIPKVKAPVVLFLNPDTIVMDGVIQKSLKFLMSNPDIGALTCRVELPDGKLDYSCHRGFPTPWNALCYFTGLSKLFPGLRLFAGYTATYLDITKAHEVDVISGAFLMVRKIAGDQIGFWDTDYFFNGEDIEFCYSLRDKGWKIFYFPEGKIIHFKGSSSGLQSTAATKVLLEVKLRAATSAAQAMRIFYKKHFYKKYPPIFRDLILLGINLLEKYRKFKVRAGLRYE